ncbi:MAG: hypothetical protein U9N62_07430 [Thermotogota bacterium]|nr:hypothetical protein [Thermotogota bacterium]
MTDEEKDLSGQNSQARIPAYNKINIVDLCAEVNERIVLEIIQSSYLFEQEIFSSSERNGYIPQNGMSVQVDRDGLGRLYTASDPEYGFVSIENNLEYIGSEGTAYEITENEGTPFWSYTLKVYRDKMPDKLHGVSEWEIEISETHEFRTNQFDDGILQFDDIEKEGQTIIEEAIKEATFEPKQ